jgi:hypothetical protein
MGREGSAGLARYFFLLGTFAIYSLRNLPQPEGGFSMKGVSR